MALRNIVNRCVHKLKPYRQFSSSTLISNYLYKSSLPILSTPWLMLPPGVKDGRNGPTDNYLNIIDKSIVKIDRSTIAHGCVPFNTKDATCIGSTKEWVVFDYDWDPRFFLANPYSIEAGCHELPRPFDIYRDLIHFTLIGDLPSNNFSLLYTDLKRCYLTSKTSEWVSIPYGPEYRTSRVAYSRKANTVYQLHLEKTGNLQIMWWHPLLDNKYVEKHRVWSLCWDPEVIEKYDELNKCPCDHIVEKYLVVTEENNPSVFFVIRHYSAKKDGVGCETKDIKLFKIDIEGAEVEYVESIGDQALFIGRYSEPFFISTCDCSGLKSNCVYVAEDLGYYDLKTKSITPFLSLGDLANIRPHVYWVAPPYSYV